MKGVGVSEVFRTFACSKTRLLYCARLARGLKYSSALYHTKKELKSKSTRGLKYGAAFGSERRKLALVTGSTSGIGLGIAKALAGSNYDIVVNGLGSDAEIDAAVLECRGEGGSGGSMTVEHHGADLSSPKQIEDLFQFIGEKFGQGPDVLVNNAGLQHVSPIERFPVDKWEQLIAVNLSAAFHTCRLAVADMKRRGWGRVVNISSVHGLVGSANKSGYVASKHGLIGLTKVVALECAGSGVTCNAISPGFVMTPLTVPQIDAISKDKGITFEEAKGVLVGGKQPSRELVMPEEVGAMVVFLCSEAARQVTGATLTIDGGWTAV